MTEGNGAATHVPEGWLLAAPLQKRFGGSARSIHRWATEGRIASVKDGQGRRWFDPADYKRALGDELELDPAQSVQLEARKAEAVLVNAAELVKASMSHLEKVLAPGHEASRELLELLRQENKDLRAQNADLMKVHLESVKAREELLSQAHERALQSEMFQTAEARKRATFDALKGPASTILKRLAGGAELVKVEQAQHPKLTAARALLASLTDEQLALLLGAEQVTTALQGLLGTGILSAEQEAHVQAVL